MMKRLLGLATPVSVLMGLCAVAHSAGIEYQHLTVKPSIDPGPNVFTNDQEWNGAGAINVYSAVDLRYKGNMGTGSMSQMAVSKGGKTTYTASVYMRRYAYGDTEMVLQIYDVATLRPVREVALPPKVDMATAYQSLLVLSQDEKYLYIQNATPATSVTVVDVIAGKVVSEIPTPGCTGVYPALTEEKFTMPCGDGTFATFTLTANRTSASRANSPRIFDVDRDPIFISGVRARSELLFISYGGTVLRVADDGPVVRLVGSFALGDGIAGSWAPGGYQVIAYNAPNDVLFVGMHPGAADGTHKAPSKEIWAVGLTRQKILYRSQVDDVSSLVVTEDSVPVLYATAQGHTSTMMGRLLRYEADPEAKFALRQTAEARNPGEFNVELSFSP